MPCRAVRCGAATYLLLCMSPAAPSSGRLFPIIAVLADALPPPPPPPAGLWLWLWLGWLV